MCSFRFRLFNVQTAGESNNVLISVDEKNDKFEAGNVERNAMNVFPYRTSIASLGKKHVAEKPV